MPESKCTLCHPQLIAQFKAAGDWCAGHRLPESVCPSCNPAVASEAHSPDSGAWCAGHGVPESHCTLCHPELIDQFKAAGDWCAGHGLPESVCPSCNPGEASEAHSPDSGAWCAGHGVPESHCTLCHAQLIPQFQAAGDWCAEHRLPESVCPRCNPDQIDLFPIEQRVVRFISPEKETQAGIRTVPIRQGARVETVSGPARIEFDANRVADLRTVVPGMVQAIYVPLGAWVEPGDPLFDLVSPRIGEVQAQVRRARARTRVARLNLERQQTLAAKKIASRLAVEQAEMEWVAAEAEVSAAMTMLETAGAAEDGPSGQLTIRAPIAGYFVRREAVIGTMADEHMSLGMLADTSQMWVFCDVLERDGRAIRPGTILSFLSDDGQQVRGEVRWIASEVDPKTHTIAVHANIENPTGTLRAHQFGRATIEVAQRRGAWLVPATAIQRVEQQEVVFVRRDQGVYVAREVSRLGAGEWTPVDGRLNVGEQVVTTGAVLLRTEMLPGSIGAGCCEVEPLGASGGSQ